MTRQVPLLAVVLGFVVAGIVGWSLSSAPSRQQDEVASLRAEIGQVKRDGRARDRATLAAALRAGQDGARLAAATPDPPPGTPPPSPEEHEAAEARVRADFEERQRAHAARLDESVRRGVADPEARAGVEKLLGPLLGPPPGRAPGPALALDSVECSRDLCRVQLGWQGPADQARLVDVARRLIRASAGLQMGPEQDGRAVYYIGTAGHPLPSLDQ